MTFYVCGLGNCQGGFTEEAILDLSFNIIKDYVPGSVLGVL